MELVVEFFKQHFLWMYAAVVVAIIVYVFFIEPNLTVKCKYCGWQGKKKHLDDDGPYLTPCPACEALI